MDDEDRRYVYVRTEGGVGPGFVLGLCLAMGEGNSYILAQNVAWILNGLLRRKSQGRAHWQMCTSDHRVILRGRFWRESRKNGTRPVHRIKFPSGGSWLTLEPREPRVGVRPELLDPRIFIEKRLRRLTQPFRAIR